MHQDSDDNSNRKEVAPMLSNLIRTIREVLADAADEPTTAWLPRIHSYPY
jgi:hypothetical protein